MLFHNPQTFKEARMETEKQTNFAFFKPICLETIQDFFDKLLEKEEYTFPINIFLASSGGNPVAAFSFYNTVKKMGMMLHVNVVGTCDSCAIIILCAAQKRTSAKGATFLLHKGRRIYEKASFTVEELKQQTKEVFVLAGRFKGIMVRTIRTELEGRGKTNQEINGIIKKVLSIMERERNITADEAYDFGFLTETPYEE